MGDYLVGENIDFDLPEVGFVEELDEAVGQVPVVARDLLGVPDENGPEALADSSKVHIPQHFLSQLFKRVVAHSVGTPGNCQLPPLHRLQLHRPNFIRPHLHSDSSTPATSFSTLRKRCSFYFDEGLRKVVSLESLLLSSASR